MYQRRPFPQQAESNHHHQPSASTANVARLTTGINGQAERPRARSGPATTPIGCVAYQSERADQALHYRIGEYPDSVEALLVTGIYWFVPSGNGKGKTE